MLVRKINKRRCKVSFCSHSDPSFVLKNNVLSFLHCIPDLWISTPLRTFYILPCDYVSDISDLRPYGYLFWFFVGWGSTRLVSLLLCFMIVGQNLFVVPKCVSLPFIFMVGGYHYNFHNWMIYNVRSLFLKSYLHFGFFPLSSFLHTYHSFIGSQIEINK